jgi:hypothetical protein
MTPAEAADMVREGDGDGFGDLGLGLGAGHGRRLAPSAAFNVFVKSPWTP